MFSKPPETITHVYDAQNGLEMMFVTLSATNCEMKTQELSIFIFFSELRGTSWDCNWAELSQAIIRTVLSQILLSIVLSYILHMNQTA